MLMQTCENEKEMAQILEGYKMITHPDKMGEKFKFISFKTKLDGDDVITGFEI